MPSFPTKPQKVSKATSGAQTVESAAAPNSHRFSVPDVLMLDSYTQTNDADRLSTKLIKCKKPTADTQTDSNDHRPPVESKPPLSKRVSFSVETNSSAANPPAQEVALQTQPEETKDVDLDVPITFQLKQTCRHGNHRSKCKECNNSVVHKRQGLSQTASFTSSPSIPDTPLSSFRAPLNQHLKEEEHDSGQESDPSRSPRISNTELARIKHVARAKLKQIKKPDSRRFSRSLERPQFIPSVVEEEEESTPTDSKKSNLLKKRKPKVFGGIESLTMQDLPRLVEPANQLSSDENSEDERGNVQKTVNKVRKYQEQKRLADVTRAKNFIKHCIETPLDDGASYKHTPRRRDSGVSSLPLIRDKQRCESEATNKRSRGIADDVESRKCVSEVPSGKMRSFDVNYKAYINALERIVDSNLNTLAHADQYRNKKK